MAHGRDGDEVFRVSRLVIDGYQRITPLEPIELRLMGELIAARSAVTIAIPAWRAARGLEEAGFAERYTLSAEAHRPDDPRYRLGRGRPGGSVRPGGRRTSASPGRPGARPSSVRPWSP